MIASRSCVATWDAAEDRHSLDSGYGFDDVAESIEHRRCRTALCLEPGLDDGPLVIAFVDLTRDEIGASFVCQVVIRCAAWIAVSAVPITPWIPWVSGQNAASIDKLDWMAGCWEGELAGGDFLFEEVWLEPRGGVMLGVSRILQEETVVEYEFLRIAEEDEALVFLVSPANQPPKLYKASEVGVGAVTFVSSEDGAPQQLQFRQESADTLSSRIESKRQGQVQNIETSLRRVRCPH